MMRPSLFALAGFLAAASLFLFTASAAVPISQWPTAIFSLGPARLDEIILLHGLFPRAGVALVAGAALGLSGALLQQLLRNPIADPSTLGISAGAQLAIVIATLFFPALLDGHRALVALSGAAIAALIVFALAWRTSFEPVTMVVSGMLVGVTAAALSASLTLAQGEYLMSLVTWNGGSLGQQDWSVFNALSLQLFLAMAAAAVLLRPLLILGLGDASARSLGINLRGVRLAVAVLATLLAGMVAANVGLISFVGLVAAALVRGCGVRSPLAALALSPLAGGLFLWFCDGVVQTVAGASGETFPTGSVTALAGGPLLLWLLPKVRSLQGAQRPQGSVRRINAIKGFTILATSLPFVVTIALLVGNDGHGWTLLTLQTAADLSSLRWPRLVAAAGAGGLLALTGAILQRLTGNAMASPEVIGVSGGASLGFAFVLTLFPMSGPYSMVAGAALGGLAAISAVLAFARRQTLPSDKLLLAGIAISSLSSAVLAVLIAAGDQRAWQILAWIGGSAASVTPGMAIFLASLSIIVMMASMFLVRWLTLLPLGVTMSRSLGVPIAASRVVTLALCGLATGAASVLVGPLSFVGLIAPHIAARAGFIRARGHLAASFFLGAVIMAFADFGARTATFPYELPLGLFAAMVGAPYLIWLITRK
jgi:iron complex transport system permease protein